MSVVNVKKMKDLPNRTVILWLICMFPKMDSIILLIIGYR